LIFAIIRPRSTTRFGPGWPRTREDGRTAQRYTSGALQVRRLNAEVKSCLSCRGKELHDTIGQMQCTACHQQLSKKHLSVPAVSPKLDGNLGKIAP